MSQLFTFRDWPVISRRRVSGGFRLRLVSSKKGKPGKTILISNHDWEIYGERVRLQPGHRLNLRRMAHDAAATLESTNRRAGEQMHE